jgi:epoxyqueuosine reductase
MFENLFHRRSRKDDAAKAGPSLDLLLNWTDKHIFNLKHLIRPAAESKPRTPFATNLPKEKVSMRNLSPRQLLQVIPKFLPLITNMVLGSRMYDREFKASRSEADPAFIAELEAMARAAGAKDIAYINVPTNAIFAGKGIPCGYAMVFTVEMDKEPISSAPSFECQLEVMDGYKRMSTISNNLSHHLRKNGFAAYPGTALGGLTDYVHLAELAGLGAIGYHGLLISPGEGARLRLNTIYTNITNLPTLEARGETNPHLWVRDFCAMCNKCVRKCPVGAIYDQPQPRGDGGFQSIDHASCRDYFTEHNGCAVCLAVCPFSQIGYEKVRAGFKGNDAAPQFQIPVQH